MKIPQRGLVLRLLCLFVLLGAAAALGPSTETEACAKCVKLDPGSAINYGCMYVTEGYIGCTPVNGNACIILGGWCKVRLPTGGGGGGGYYEYPYGGGGGGGYCAENWVWDASCQGPDDSFMPMSSLPTY